MKKALFVGLGSIGQRHLRNLRKLLGDSIDIMAYRASRSVPLLDENRCVVEGESVSDRYNVREFDDYDKALSEKPDMVFVTNPSSMHIETALKAAEAGCHLLIEKPLGNNAEGLEKLIECVERNNLIVLVAYQLRFHPGLKKVEDWLKEKRIGKLISAQLIHGENLTGFHPYEDYRISYASRKDLGGGVVLSQIHEFDYALRLFGKPRRIFALGGKSSQLEIDVEDNASALMECEVDGSVLPVSLSLDFIQKPPHRTCVIIGEKGRIVCELHDSKTVLLETAEPEKCESFSFSELDKNRLFLDELTHFMDAIEGKAKPVVDLKSGSDSMQMALATLESIKTGEVQILS